MTNLFLLLAIAAVISQLDFNIAVYHQKDDLEKLKNILHSRALYIFIVLLACSCLPDGTFNTFLDVFSNVK